MTAFFRGLLVAVVLMCAGAPLRVAAAPAPQPAIGALLARSAAAWNRGDLATFMRSYEHSPDTMYVSSHAVIRGYAAIRAHYASAYHGGMGVLTFSDLSIRPLGDRYAVVVARWHLALAGGKRPSGLFTLVVHRSRTGWGIINDHSP